MTMVPKKLQKNQREIKRTHEEIKEDYLFAVKKSIVDFVLKEPEIDEDERFLDEDDETPMTIELAGKQRFFENVLALDEGMIELVVLLRGFNGLAKALQAIEEVPQVQFARHKSFSCGILVIVAQVLQYPQADRHDRVLERAQDGLERIPRLCSSVGELEEGISQNSLASGTHLSIFYRTKIPAL